MPKVFLDYTQTELDQAYDQLVWAPHRDAIQAEIRKECEAVRKACGRIETAELKAIEADLRKLLPLIGPRTVLRVGA